MEPNFHTLSQTTGLAVVDPVENRRVSLLTDTPVSPANIDETELSLPVDSACSITTDRIRVPYPVAVHIREADGDYITTVDTDVDRRFSTDEYILELQAPVKLYLRVQTSFVITQYCDSGLTVQFDDKVSVAVGARVYHSQPTTTITVPDDEQVVMKAVAQLSSGLKTTSPERAWPTQRGHPPRLELGADLNIPDGVNRPNTDVTLAIPPEYPYIFSAAPLSYYLAADLQAVDGTRPELLAGDTMLTRFRSDIDAFADEVADLLQRILALDCVVRTEGHDRSQLYERAILEDATELDLAVLYDAEPTTRLETYLEVPDRVVEEIQPTWHRVTHVRPDTDVVELLPYIVNDLSLVKIASRSGEWTPSAIETAGMDALDAFVRSPNLRAKASASGFTRSKNLIRSGDEMLSTKGVPGKGGYVPLPDSDTVERAWVGERAPLRGTKLLPEAFESEEVQTSDGVVEVVVICNDDRMREEWETVTNIYGSRHHLQMQVDCQFNVSTTELQNLLARDVDVLHFIGHIDGEGFACPDGVVDTADVETVNASTILLNGCRSYNQGQMLVEEGASAAIVSLSDLWNDGAVEVGEVLAKLLQSGFTVGTVLELIRQYTSLGSQYVVLGDPGVTAVESGSGPPTLYRVDTETTDSKKALVEPVAYPSRSFGIGSTVQPLLTSCGEFRIAGGRCGKEEVPIDALSDIVQAGNLVVINGEMMWGEWTLPEQ
ncbi:hypothetical protein [Halorussus ruber]|uniref:hypothetical protein n=1 Tax=Halorussus ruber TaxID=1126238 RepID=UPI001092C69E|nr:hypothetical protein [Halorussus ruber]